MADVAAMDIVIGADVTKAVTGFNIVQKELAQTAIAAQKTDSSFQKISKGTGQATNALTNLGRVVQDAPYGFIGIANNINPLLESFQRAQKDAGSFGGALKNMGKELTGAAGIGLAVSIVTSLIVVFGDKISFTSKEVEAAAKAHKDYTDAMASSIAPAQTQITTLNNLLSISRDVTQSSETHKNAVNELARLYPELGKTIKATGINSEETKKQIDKLTDSMILQAKVMAISNLLTKAYEDLAKAQNAVILDNTDGWDALGAGILNAGNAAGTVSNLVDKSLKNQKTAIDAAQKSVTNYSGQLKTLQTEQAQGGEFKTVNPEHINHIKDAADVIKELTKSLKDFNTEQQGIGGDFRDNMIKAIDNAVTELIKLGVAADDPRIQNLLKIAKGITQTMNDAAAAIQTTREKIDLSKIKDILPDRLARGPGLTIDTPAIKEATKGMQFLSDNLENVKKVTQDIQGIFEQTFEAMAKGGQNAITTLFSLFEQLLIKMVATTAAAALLAVILNSISFGGASLGSLMGLGKGFKGIFAGLLHFQHGGIVTGPTRALIGEAGPEVVFPLDRLREFIQPAQSQIVVLETRVRGSDIWLSQSRTNERMRRTY